VVGEVGRAAYRDPSGFDKSPAQPFVATRHEAALVGLASAAGGGGAEAGVTAEEGVSPAYYRFSRFSTALAR
jgi:hypothetical protein